MIREHIEFVLSEYSTDALADKLLELFDEEAVVRAIYDCTSADVRPNIHARWESDGHGHIICSACKEANVSTWKSRFCPMCGARMDEVKHDE